MIPKIGTIILVLGLVAVASFGLGCKVGSALKDRQIIALQAKAQEAREKQLANLRAIEQEREAKEAVAAALEIERSKQAQVIERTVTRDVIKYVRTPAAAVPCLDDAGLRIINAAARVPDIEATGRPDAKPATTGANARHNRR